MKRNRRSLALASAVGMVAVLWLGAAAARAECVPAIDAGSLPPPFDGWNVEIVPGETDPQILYVDFDSELLGFRARNLVWIPDHYCATADPLPVMYYLHGTVTFTNVEVLPPPENPATRPGTMGLDETLDRQRFVVVGPDAGKPWCLTCNWIDGKDGGGHQADSHIQREVQPLVEALLRVRTDRGGRGVMGHSMGGGGALIQGFRHPDRYAFVGSSSGAASILDDPISVLPIRWALYNRHQNLLPGQVDEIHYRNFNILDLAPGVVGTGMEIIAVAGDACLDPATMNEGSCEGFDPADFMDWGQEAYQRYATNDLVMPKLVQLGVPVTYVKREGPHSIGTSTYRRYFMEAAHRVFESAVPDPARFTYKTADDDFTIWGYRFRVERPNVEFLNVTNGALDGRDVTLGGTGTVTMTTPAVFAANAAYRVVVIPAGGAGEERTIDAGADGRLTVDVVLGPGRPVDERRVYFETGRFPIAQTRIRILDP